MNSIIDQYILVMQNLAKRIKRKILIFSRFFKNNRNEISSNLYDKFEIEKSKLELKKQYMKLGRYVHKKKQNNNMYDFTYDDGYMEINAEIEKIIDFINSLRIQKTNNK